MKNKKNNKQKQDRSTYGRSRNLQQVQEASTSSLSTLHADAYNYVSNYNNLYIRKLTWSLLILGSVGLLIFSAYRAATYPFTHDESLSFLIFSWNSFWGQTSNNHWLNTLLMHLCSSLFGNSEFSLRLPNVLAHLMYLTSTLLLLKRFHHTILLIIGFVLLNLNPFLLDFFFLARGYGLALSFMMLSLYLLVRACEEKQNKYFAYYLYVSVLAGSLAVLANLTFLNYLLPLLLACAWLLFTDTSMRQLSLRNIRMAIILFLTSGIFLSFILSKAFRLKQLGELYFGGSTGFIVDTIGSLIHGSLYSISVSQATESAISTTVVILFILFWILGLYMFFLRKERSQFLIFLLLLTLAVVSPIIQNRLFQTLFPIERTALYYLPLEGVVLLSAIDWLVRYLRNRWIKSLILLLTTVIAVIITWNFYLNFNTRSCYTWSYDYHDNEVLEIINMDRIKNFPGQFIILSNSWQMEPSLNYYRITRRYNWLAPVSREPITSSCRHYIYAFESEIKDSLVGQVMRLVYYPDTRTVLLRINSVHCP